MRVKERDGGSSRSYLDAPIPLLDYISSRVSSAHYFTIPRIKELE